LKILFAVSESAPFIKTGGLADVAGSLPSALAAAGHEVTVMLPLYEGIDSQWREQMTFCRSFTVTLSWRNSYCGIFSLQRNGVTYWFVDNEYYFKRSDIYGHFDDGERFAYFSRAIIEAPDHMGLQPDVIHCNDWQTALVPVYLKGERSFRPALKDCRCVFTIHNIEYQGRYSRDICEDVFGIARESEQGRLLEYRGENNLMKAAICASDFVTTVSPSYACELQDDFYAHGLAQIIRMHEGKIRGILNGLDTELYDPATDFSLAAPFSPADLSGKHACRAALQSAVGLNREDDIPIIACVSRLVPHKGFDLVLAALDRIMDLPLQMVVLGTGNWQYEEAFRQAALQYPGRFAARLQYSATLSSAIYAGADLFLMPSISEPCGLSQMIAMRYGTVPIVRETGGLRDSVPPYSPEEKAGLGFTFRQPDADVLLDTVRNASYLWKKDPSSFAALRQRGMTADFTWLRSAAEYLDVYRSTRSGI